jgi:hypothetical protein
MKNEVKKKMMIDRRKSWHQSHGERTSSAKVNKIFVEGIVSRLLFILKACPGSSRNCASREMARSTRPATRLMLTHAPRRAFSGCNIYNESREIFAGA